MNIREIAFNLLDNIYKNKSFSNIELNKTIREENLSSLDKNFLTRLIYGTIKEYRMLDYEINKATDNKNIKPSVRTLLKLSLYQIRFMDKVPNYAIINEAVEIAKNKFGLMSSKFVNAVLRRLTGEHFIPIKEEYENEMDYYCLIFSFPNWIGHMIEKQYNKEIALSYMYSYHFSSPLSLRVNTLKTTIGEILNNPDFEHSKFSEVGVIYKGDKSINELDEFINGLVIPQGESSQLVSILLNPKENDNVLDMCAAPGGKTYHLAALMNNTGNIYSVDIYDHRIKLLVNNLPRLNIKNVKAYVYDATKLNNLFKDYKFDKILLDAPCSGLGVVRRKPDLLFNLNQNDLDNIISLQEKLIDSAIELLKDNGEMVYSTCTINKKENTNQIKYLLNKYPFMKLITETTILPNESNVDGFYMAKLRKETND